MFVDDKAADAAVVVVDRVVVAWEAADAIVVVAVVK